MSVPAIAARDLGRLYGAFPALDRIALEVAGGESVLLAGPNGAGKSTLLKVLALLVRPGAGTLRLFGQDVRTGDRAALRRRIGLLSHQTYLYDHLTGEENLVFFARLYGLEDPAGTARRALVEAGLDRRGDDQVRTYSRGMQQRLALARVFLHRPELVLLDEPFTGLDAEGADRLEAHLRRARADGGTFLLATHGVPAALRLADRVVVLASGRVLHDLPAEGMDLTTLDDLVRSAATGSLR